MADEEESLMEELGRLKRAARQEVSTSFPSAKVEEWIPTYLRWIDHKLCDEVELGHWYVSEYKTHPDVQAKEILHATRRRVAILHQEVDLLEQGPDVYDTAVHYYEMVGGGCRYVNILFTQIFAIFPCYKLLI